MTFGSTDADAFQYDANTGRMTQYKATINGSAVSGALTWNANWTLKQLVTVDPYNAGNNNKTCGYTYDDLARLSQVDCGSGNWGQTFSYLDNVTNNIAAFGNISKNGDRRSYRTELHRDVFGYHQPPHHIRRHLRQ